MNLLASDGVESAPNLGARAVEGTPENESADTGIQIQRRSDGKLDLGQVKAYYERKNIGLVRKEDGKGLDVVMTDRPGSTDHSTNRNFADGRTETVQFRDDDASVSQPISGSKDQAVAPSRESGRLALATHHADLRGDSQGREGASSSLPPTKGQDTGQWVDSISEREAKELLLEISEKLNLKLPRKTDPQSTPRSATDRPRTLSDIRKAIEFLERIDELVWRRSEYDADLGVFDSKNIAAVEERVKLWERLARGPCS